MRCRLTRSGTHGLALGDMGGARLQGGLSGVASPSAQSSALRHRHAHHQPVELRRDRDLAGQPRVSAHVEGEVQHLPFAALGRAQAVQPLQMYVDMAGSAGTGAAAFGIDARHAVGDGGAHEALAVRGQHHVLAAAVFYEGDGGHGVGGEIGRASCRERV